MKYFLTGIGVILSFVMTAELAADKVYTWTDEKGNLHITQDPPPKKAELKETMDYEPRPAKVDLESEGRPQTGAASERRKQKSDEARRARAEAEKAKEAADIASAKAEEATRMAEEYSKSNNPNRYMQQTYDYQMEQALEEVKAAEERARIAEEKAIDAEKKVESAQGQAKQDDD